LREYFSGWAVSATIVLILGFLLYLYKNYRKVLRKPFALDVLYFSAPHLYSSISTTSSSDTQTIIRLAEEKIRIKTIALGLRVTEFFHDFDRLRSGYITASQFKR
jgi:hypothetical protein